MASSGNSKASHTLTELVKSLSLSPGRTSIPPKSASNMTPSDMKAANIVQLETVDDTDRKTLPFQQHWARSKDIIQHLSVSLHTYFNALHPENLTDEVKIPVQVMDDINAKDVKTHEQWVNAVTSITVRWVINNLGPNDYNPFAIEVVAQESVGVSALENLPKTNAPEDPQMKIHQLVSEDQSLDLDKLKSIMSWFYPMSLTAEPEGEGQRSETTVQHVVGSAIRCAAQLSGCRVWSDLKLHYPDILKLAYNQTPDGKIKASDASPDIATIPVIPGKEDKMGSFDILEQLLQPIVIVGEAKTDYTGERNGRPPNPSRKHYTAQMMMAVHPTLVLLILLYLRGDSFDLKKHAGPLPKEFFIYGVYYDEKRFLIYAHFPYFSIDVGNYGWRFVQAKVKEFNFATYSGTSAMGEESARRRLQFAIAMQAVRDHGRKLCELFSSTEYKEVVEKIGASSR